MIETVPAFGLQREMLRAGVVDNENWLRAHPLFNAWNVTFIEGPLDIATLRTAIRLGVDTDILNARVVLADGSPTVLVSDTPHDVVVETGPESTLDADGVLDPIAGAWVAERVLGHYDNRHDPLIRAAVLPMGDNLTGLILSFDHSISDGWTIWLLTRRVAKLYTSLSQNRDTNSDIPRVGSFAEFARITHKTRTNSTFGALSWWQAAERELNSANLGRLGTLLKDDPDEWVKDGYYHQAIPSDAIASVNRIGSLCSLYPAQVWNAVTNLTLDQYAGEFLSVMLMRHGRPNKTDLYVPGPLTEPVVSVPPSGRTGLSGLEYIQAYAHTNHQTPSLKGANLFELSPSFRRPVGVNVIPPVRPLSFGSAHAYSARPEQVDSLYTTQPPESDDLCNFWAMWITFRMDSATNQTLTIDFDTEVVDCCSQFAEAIFWNVTEIALSSTTPEG